MKATIAQIYDASFAALRAHGAAEFQAGEVAKAVARAEETGNIICGLYYLESYCLQLASGRVNGTVEPAVSRPRPGSVLADAAFGFAQPAFARALPQAVAAARENGTASLAVTHAHTCTSLGFFTEQIAAQGLIAIGFTNASAIVVPPGGTARTLGTNPMACTVPGERGPVLHVDCSTSAVAVGKIPMANAAGESIPLGWAVDANGDPTTDPAEALKGGLVSAGGYKGWALGLLVEVLAAGMSGGVNSVDVKGLKLADGPPHDLGQFYLILDPGVHGPHFTERFAKLADLVEAQEGARIPGASRRLLSEVDVPNALWSLVQGLA
jgi:(2R)-3-sulfolactate dehydrogenase (NADP+)